MNQKKTVDANVGDRVRAGYEGRPNSEAIEGKVTVNNEKQCVILRDNGLTATIFGNLDGDESRRWPSVKVAKM